jgi:HK97 family phage prohead protease
VSVELEHKAVETTTRVHEDLGEFSAFAATYDVDRVKDRIRFGAFEKTIARWQASGKRIPLHWAHRGEAKNVIGSVDPATAREVAGLGLYVEGKLDLDESEVAREAWRSMKDNRVGLSFGYLVPEGGQKRINGINNLLELDLYEISVAPGEINPETRFLSLKSDTAERDRLELRELRRRSDEMTLEVLLGCSPDEFRARQADTKAQIPTDAELRAQCKALGFAVPAPRKGTRIDLDAVRAEAKALMIAQLRGADREVT